MDMKKRYNELPMELIDQGNKFLSVAKDMQVKILQAKSVYTEDKINDLREVFYAMDNIERAIKSMNNIYNKTLQ